VLWRFDGKKPETLGSNTRLYKWLPQNDLLGIFPMPLRILAPPISPTLYFLCKQRYKENAMRVSRIQHDQPMKPLDRAIFWIDYKENAMRLSRIHRDQPVKPLDRAVFWIELVMCNKGAKNLHVAAHDLTWFQYHSLDVLGFLQTCVVTVMLIFMKCYLFCCQKFAKA
ncbi:hypothetical protein STEG23_009885, partial [Scotinomys teguina]